MNRKAFTLMELVVVVALVGLLTAIAVPNFMDSQNHRNVSRVKSDLQSMSMAIDAYTLDQGKHPREQNSYFYGPADRLPNRQGVPSDVQL